MSSKLFGGSDESDGELQLNTNKDYAKSYNHFRKKELLKKFKDRGYDDVSESESTSESDSSEEDEVLDPKFDEEFFKTLASLKSKDPAIYDKETRFFGALNEGSGSEEDEQGISNGAAISQKQKKAKPVTLKDYERKIILEKEGKFEDDSDYERPASPTLAEEEQHLRAEFKKVLNEDDSEEEEFGGIFKKRQKTKEERDNEDADFIKWLAGKQENVDETVEEQLKPLKNYWSSDKLPQSERFLRDYILNKGYADTKFADIPTYDEIVGDQEPLSEDEKELEKQADFEQKYNFRFEEPDAEFIQRFPRTIEQSVRRTDDRRKQKRQELKERKQQEKEQKMKELELVKQMKRKEIEEKIQKLKMVTGNDELGFKDEELEEDFDPEAHDRRMQELFNDDYYQVDEGEDKPECPSDIEELKVEDWDNYDPKRGFNEDFEPHCEDEDFVMDCDYDPATAKEQLQQELIENTKKRKNRKGRRNCFMEMIQQEKPAFDPEDEKTYAEYIDEFYKLDCEDIIGDIPCRFKYVETTPNDFGLSIEEILLAKNKELNQWASLKKAIQIRPEQVEKKEQRLYKMKANNEELKRKIFKSLYGEGSDDEDEAENQEASTSHEANTNQATTQTGPESKNAKKKKKRKAAAAAALNVATGVATTAKEIVKPAKQTAVSETVVSENQPPITAETQSQSTSKTVLNKKKKKRKNKAAANSSQTTQQPTKVNAQKPAIGETACGGKKPAANAKPNPFNKNSNAKVNAQKPSIGETACGGKKPAANAKPNPFNKNSNVKVETKRKPNAFSSLHKTNNGKVVKAKLKPKSNKTNKKFNVKINGSEAKISDERLKAYGINPRKFHKKQKFGKPQH